MPLPDGNTIRVPNLPGFTDGDLPASDDLLIVYDTSTGVTRRANIADLPFTAGGGGGSVTFAAGMWKVRTYSPGFIYDETAGNSIVSDLRLIGIEDGVIYSTQVAAEFREDQLTFDPEAGTATLLNFELSPNEHITININGAANYAYNSALQSALEKLANQAAISAPFQPTALGASGAKVLWMRPANEIPAGWQECIAMRGKFPMAQDPNDTDFSGTIGTAIGGSKSAKLTINNIPEHDHDYRATALSGSPGDKLTTDILKQDNDIALYLGQTKKTGKAGKTDPDAINFMNPYRIVMWIEYAGV